MDGYPPDTPNTRGLPGHTVLGADPENLRCTKVNSNGETDYDSDASDATERYLTTNERYATQSVTGRRRLLRLSMNYRT